MTPQQLANTIKGRMIALNLRREDLATRTGLSMTTVHKLLQGRSKYPRTVNLAKVASALDMRPIVTEDGTIALIWPGEARRKG